MFTMDTKQQNIHKELLELDKKSAGAYEGSLKVLRDRENPDRFSRSAHSLREITTLMSIKISIPQESKEKRKSLENKLEKQFIEKTDLLPSPAQKKTKVLLEKWGGNYINNYGGSEYKEIKRALERIKATTIKSTGTFYSKEGKQR